MNLDDYITGTFDTRNPANQGEADPDFDELGFYKRQFKNQCIITKWHISNLMRLAELERIENLNYDQITEKNEILQNYENTI